MQPVRFVRTLVPLLIVGCVLGCSSSELGGRGVTPPDKETSKKIAEERKEAARERMKAMRSQMKGRGPG
jgi:hypothetical protein